jgi:hypothetical protein
MCTHLRTYKQREQKPHHNFDRTGMADTSVIYFYPDLVGLWWSNFDILNR